MRKKRKTMGLFVTIFMGGALLIGCNNTTKENNTKDDSSVSSQSESKEDKVTTIKEGNIEMKKDGDLIYRIVDGSNKPLDEDMQTKIKPIIKELSKMTGSNHFDIIEIKGSLTYTISSDDYENLKSHKDEIIKYLKSNMTGNSKIRVTLSNSQKGSTEGVAFNVE